MLAHGRLNQKTASGIATEMRAIAKPSFVAGWTCARCVFDPR